MLRAFRKLRNRPVSVVLADEEAIGGGVALGTPKLILLFTGVDCLWVSLKWKWSGQIVIVPASDVVCIAHDRKGPS